MATPEQKEVTKEEDHLNERIIKLVKEHPGFAGKPIGALPTWPRTLVVKKDFRD